MDSRSNYDVDLVPGPALVVGAVDPFAEAEVYLSRYTVSKPHLGSRVRCLTSLAVSICRT